MNDLGSLSSDEASPDGDWLDALSAGRPTPETVAALRRRLAGRPSELRRMEQELALNALLDARPNAPVARSNFAARVASRIEAGNRHPRTAWTTLGRGIASWISVLRRRPVWALGLVAVTGALAWQWAGHSRRWEMAATAAQVAQSVTAPGLPPENLADYEAIRRLGTIPRPEDEALIAALAENYLP